MDAKDRSLSIGLGIFLISIFALLPAPIAFGSIIGKIASSQYNSYKYSAIETLYVCTYIQYVHEVRGHPAFRIS